MNVYDFDNTIYDGESVIDFFFFCLKKKPALAKLLPAVVSTWVKYKLCVVSLEELTVRAEKYACRFLREAGELRAGVREFWDTHERKIKPFYKNLQREDDLVLSASCDFLLDEICRRIGIKNCIASSIDTETGKINFICYHRNKVALFRQSYPDAVVDNFYTDSKNDLPMMRLARNAYLVKGNKITKMQLKEGAE